MPDMGNNSGYNSSSSDVTTSEARNGEVAEWRAPVRPPYLAETASYSAFLEHSPEVIDPSNGGSLLEYWRILCRRKGIILLLALLGGLVGVGIVSTQPKTYKAQVDLELKDINTDFPNIKPQMATYFALSDISTQIRILQSKGLADRTKAKVKKTWQGVPIEDNYTAPFWRLVRFPSSNSDGLWAEVVPQRQTISLDSLLKAAADGMKVHESGMTRVIEVEVDSVDAKLASDFANALAQEFIDQNIEARWKTSEHTGDWLESQLQATRSQLERSENNLQAYARSAGLLFPGGVDGKSSASVSEDRLREIQASLSASTSDRVAKQSRYDIARASPPEGLPDVLNDASLRDYRSKMTELEREIADLTAVYTADYPKVKRLEAQLKLVQSNFARQRAALLEGIKNDYEEALKRENLLIAEYDKQARTVTGENEKAIRYSILRHDVDSNQQLLDAMLQRIKEAGVSAALRESNVRILDAAKIPQTPYKPTVAVDVGVGLFAGLFLGLVVAVVRERSDRSFRGPGQTTAWLNIPEIGIIPDKKHNSAKGLYSPGRPGRKEGALLQAPERSLAASATNGLAISKGPELVTLHRKSSMMAEAFRIVLPYVISRNRNENDLRSIVLTSANPEEGKTTVVCNLAIAFAEIGKKVLLVDGDLRRPRLHNVFGLDNTFGLCSFLQDNWTSIKPVSEMGSGAGSGVISENLYVLPSGPPIGDVGKALFTERLPELFATLKEEFDIVLIDSPPVLQIPDARVLGRSADGVILVVRAGHTTREAALAAVRSLSDVHCRVLGTILNYWDPNGFPFASYAGYYRH